MSGAACTASTVRCRTAALRCSRLAFLLASAARLSIALRCAGVRFDGPVPLPAGFLAFDVVVFLAALVGFFMTFPLCVFSDAVQRSRADDDKTDNESEIGSA